MFDELYKSANDKISSESAYNRFAAELDGRRKRNIRPTAMRAAALAACFTLSFCGIKLYDMRDNSPTEITEKISTETVPTELPSGEIKEVLPETKKSAPKVKKATPAPKAVSEYAEKVEATSPEPQYDEAETVTAESADITAETTAEPTDVPMLLSETAPTEEIAIKASGGAVKRSLDDYNEFVGRDIRNDVCLPKGMTDKTEETASVGDGWNFVYEGNGKRAEIQTYPSDTEKSEGNDENTASVENGCISFSANGIDFEIETEGFTDEEVYELVTSLGK